MLPSSINLNFIALLTIPCQNGSVQLIKSGDSVRGLVVSVLHSSSIYLLVRTPRLHIALSLQATLPTLYQPNPPLYRLRARRELH